MLVKLKSAVAGRRFAYRPGVHDVPDNLAKKLIDSGQAEKVETRGRPRKTSISDSQESEE